MEVLRLWSETGVIVNMDFLATSGNPGIFDEEARRLGAQDSSTCATGAPTCRDLQRNSARCSVRGSIDAIHDHQDYTSGWHFLMGAGLLPAVRVTHVHNPSYQILNNYGVTPCAA